MKKFFYKKLSLILPLVIFFGCSTEKNTFMHRGFHDMTARYNGYFYAKESIKEGSSKLYKSHKDDYTRVLPIYKLGDESASKNIYPEMDKAYKKSSMVIQRHSIFIKGQEYCSWIDDNYLLIGIGHYYKRDFFAALEIFEYVAKQYKKEEIRYDAMVWMLRTYNEAAIVSTAQLLIDNIQNDKNFPRRLIKEFNIALADFYLKQENYPKTIEALKTATSKSKFDINKENYKQYLVLDHSPKLEKSKPQKTRLLFVLAQLLQKENDHLAASRYFAKVVSRNPEYEMAFQAKISQAKSYDVNSKSNKNIKEQLQKMLKDAKNTDYFDQIYFALGEIAFRENDEILALEYLKKSVANSINNPKQKAFSYLKLAEYNFKKTDYPVSFAYYDSAIVNLPKDYIDYEKYLEKKESLSKVVKNVNVITKEDSLQRIARMGETERDKFIDNLIEDLVKKEEEKKRLEAENKLIAQNNQLFQDQNNQSQNNNGSGASWYFYNTSSVSMGYAEFAKKWGDRKNEDNWRRKNKEVLMMDDVEGEIASEDSSAISMQGDIVDQIKNKDNYQKELPLTAAKMNKSTEKIVEAYYNLGSVYKEDLNDYASSIKAFETLNARFPQNKYLLPVYYQLYRSNLKIDNEPRAEYYKNVLLNDYPESPYSKLIRNPDFAKESMASKNEIENLYTQTYESYQKGQYENVITNCNLSQQQFPKSFLTPKFDLLNAMAIGKTKGVLEFEGALKTIVIQHPKDEVKIKAEELLKYLESIKPKSTNQNVLQDTLYRKNDSLSHLCVIVFPKIINSNTLKEALINYNEQYFSLDNFSYKMLLFDVDNQLMVVGGMTTLKKAQNYFNAIQSEKSITNLISGSKIFLMTDENLPTFLKDKDLERYLKFFNKEYLDLN